MVHERFASSVIEQANCLKIKSKLNENLKSNKKNKNLIALSLFNSQLIPYIAFNKIYCNETFCFDFRL